MKNREYRMLIAGALLLALTVGSFASQPLYAKESSGSIETEAVSKPADNTEATSKAGGTTEVRPVKDETVYAKVNGQGDVESVIVSDQLRNVTNKTDIQDTSQLQNIENVKGDETFSNEDEKLIWNGQGEDIVYQGTTEETLPVGIEITYELDGKQINAEELEGKSGHLVMRYTYKNISRENTGGYVPFLMATGVVFDGDVFSNVAVTNGKLLSDGSRDMAVGIGMPQMQEELGTDLLDIPEYFEIEADVKEYQAPEAITIATNDVFNEIDTEQFNSISDLKSSMAELQSAANQLVSGSGELKTGLDTLLSSSGTLTDGIQALVNGGAELKEGTLTLADGAQQVTDGLGTASSQVSSVLAPGAASLDAGATQMQQQLEVQLPTLSGSIADLNTGIGEVAEGAKALNENMETVASGAQSVSSGIDGLAESTGTLYAGAESVYTYLNTMSSETGAIDTTSSQEEIAALQNLVDSGAVTGETAAALEDVIASLSTEQQTRDSVNVQRQAQGTAAPAEVLAAAEAVKNGLYTADQALNGEQGLAAGAQTLSTTLSTQGAVGGGIAQLDAALNQGNPATGTPGIAAGIQSLETAVSGEEGLVAQVSAGMTQLKGGTSSLLAGVEGEDGLAAGLSALYTGANGLSEGAEALNSGANTLTAGLGTLQSGSGALIDGVVQLDEGAAALNDGMLQFNEEGIEKLTEVFEGDVGSLLDKMNEMLDASRKYNNFSGISDEMEGHVKFIFVTE